MPGKTLGAAADAELAETLYALLSAMLRHRPREMSMTSSSTLAALLSDGPMRVTALAARQGVTQPTMTTLVHSLERDGLVVRMPDPADGRATLVRLTDAGAELVRDRRRQYAEVVAGYVRMLPDGRRRSLDEALPAIRALETLMRGDPA
ncbi:MarR family transcriptional regulator [Gordonia amarae]|uniref:MarR family transcriptional regulator n=1 Tax=Gordonia amarae TaxID=36821 RepID=A0A857KQN0_9ACTN|nr:MarR family transcriptional regulator [Gordonia amarae]QHN24070.1 MarR family transcriptional regulator [Gordonia amarae]QHN32987.1 MarR family transcriptional regulator [Gordonia amarae]QHN41708.1 MarR family transcriptional regulator [Gordonia amarae]